MFKEEISALAKFLKAANSRYAVIGGLAVSIYGEPRMTFDIDVNIILDKNDTGKFIKLARRYGFSPIPARIESFVKKTGVMPLKFSKGGIFGRCDIIIAENIIEYSGIKRAKTVRIGKTAIKVITPEDLVIHKITSLRPRDIEDLDGILLRQKGKLDIRYIRRWLKKIAEANKKPSIIKEFNRLIR